MRFEEGQNRNRAEAARGRPCAACGAAARRDGAKFCLVCGKLLGESYQPLDALRASYRLQGRRLAAAAPETPPAPEAAPPDLFARNRNGVAQTAWACLVYSLVPYLGILFVPLTLVIGGAGYVRARRRPQLGGGRLALASLALSVVVLAVQLLFWWLLYKIPELGRG